MNEPTSQQKPRNLGLTAAACVVFVAGMVGMSYAAVPLYRIFCQVTGYDGTPLRADAAPDRTIERTITVRFDGNVMNGLGWSFRPIERQVKIKVGEVKEISFRAESRMPTETTGTASFNVTPEIAGAYFNKLACFCFSEQTLKPGEVVDMPVQFFIDPAIAEDRELDYIDTITLSYTFFPSTTPARPVAEAASAGGKPL